MKRPILLCILDGFGLGNKGPEDAVFKANTPVFDSIYESCPHSSILASGLDVGLPRGQMGNSEVGHTNIGAGRVVFQDLPRITKSIEDGDFFENAAFIEAIEAAKANGKALHLIGLMSDGGVHSHNTHTWAFLELAKRRGLDRVYIHCIMDGRDVPPTSGVDFVAEAVKKCVEIGVGKIATVMGRYYAMDRDNRWERVERAYNAMTMGEGYKVDDPVAAVKESYDKGVTDEFIEPVICQGDAAVSKGDSVIFTNFRPDRAREITRAFVDPDFTGFERKTGLLDLNYVCLTQYDATMPRVKVAYPPQSLENTFGEYISSLGYTQLRIAETEKYAHVTFFFNGGVEKVYPGESRILIPSPKVPTYDLKPEMSAYEVADKVVECIGNDKYDVIILNFANCDMVGHTGVFDAAVKAVEAVDICLGRVLDAMASVGGITLVTADHGNAERMLEDDGVSPFTAHTTNPVPLVVVGANVRLKDGRLCDLTPTILDLMGLEKPDKMEGESLIVVN